MISTGTDLPFVQDLNRVPNQEPLSHARVHACRTALARKLKGDSATARVMPARAAANRMRLADAHTANLL